MHRRAVRRAVGRGGRGGCTSVIATPRLTCSPLPATASSTHQAHPGICGNWHWSRARGWRFSARTAGMPPLQWLGVPHPATVRRWAAEYSYAGTPLSLPLGHLWLGREPARAARYPAEPAPALAGRGTIRRITVSRLMCATVQISPGQATSLAVHPESPSSQSSHQALQTRRARCDDGCSMGNSARRILEQGSLT
jgi:hypothetical protein